jgi:Ca-activated chloride channel family protein
MDVKVCGASSIESPTHRLSMAVEGDDLRVRLQEGEVIPDRDCVLIWKPKQDGARPTLKAMAHEDASGDTYFMAMLAPPASKDLKKVPGEYVILIDHSGSMSGPKKEAAEWAVEKFLLGLGPDDWFTLGAFSDSTRWYSKWLANTTEESVKNAVQFMKSRFESGGTQLGVALEQALDVKKLKGNVSRHVLIITDAEVTDAGRIFRLVDRESRGLDNRSISLLCIDAAPNSYLATAIAERGGGIIKFLTSDPSEGDISSALDAILDDWRQPLLAGLRLIVDRPGLDSTSGPVHLVSDGSRYYDIGDLPAGRTVWVAGKVTGTIGDGLTIQVSNQAGTPIASFKVTKNDSMPRVKPLFGAKKLLGLEYLIHSRYTGNDLKNELGILGYDLDQIFKKASTLYPENSQVNETEALRDFIVKESLYYGLPSSETALIAVYHKAGKRVEATALVPNALPGEWSEDFATQCAPAPMGGLPDYSASRASRRSRRSACSIIDVIEGYPSGSSNYSHTEPSSPPASSKSTLFNNVFGKKVFGNANEDVEEFCEVDLDEYEPVVKKKDPVIFAGAPQFKGTEALLFDSALNGRKLPDAGKSVIRELCLVFKQPTTQVPENLAIRIFVEDLISPRAVIQMADLVRQGGIRPLNIVVNKGERMQVILSDPSGAWANSAPEIEISFRL